MAFSAGMVNAVTFYALGAFVSHVTGTLTKTALYAEGGASGDACEIFFLIIAFMVGSGICGCLISRGNVAFSNGLYGAALVANAGLLIVALLAVPSKPAPYILAAACGLQNGVATSFTGGVIRVTHATGLTTDIGLLSGRAVMILGGRLLGRPRPPPEKDMEGKKLLLLIGLFFSFLCGAALGAMLHGELGVQTLLLPAAMTGFPGAIYAAYRLRQHLKAKHQPETTMVTEWVHTEGSSYRGGPRNPEVNHGSLDDRSDSHRSSTPEVSLAMAPNSKSLDPRSRSLSPVHSPRKSPRKELGWDTIREETPADLVAQQSRRRREATAEEVLLSLEGLLLRLQEAAAQPGDAVAATALEAHQRCKEAQAVLARQSFAVQPGDGGRGRMIVQPWATSTVIS
mmetsp:Transcript_86849/g.223646  ORF Transcript_86849/g.223646 Transcript_86849/m.223646 type:complete len:398 (+) Transcript_86849:1-1194(+)